MRGRRGVQGHVEIVIENKMWGDMGRKVDGRLIGGTDIGKYAGSNMLRVTKLSKSGKKSNVHELKDSMLEKDQRR